MPPYLRVRTLTDTERSELRRWAEAWRLRPVDQPTEERHRDDKRTRRDRLRRDLATRARIVWLAVTGSSVKQIARAMRVSQPTVRLWIKRYNERGFDGLHDGRRTGRHLAVYTPEQIDAINAAALSPPYTVGRPGTLWSLDLLTSYVNDTLHIPISRRRLYSLLPPHALIARRHTGGHGP